MLYDEIRDFGTSQAEPAFFEKAIGALGDFFFQAEDGIRDLYVTGVHTCALPISIDIVPAFYADAGFLDAFATVAREHVAGKDHVLFSFHEIGRASCRERV